MSGIEESVQIRVHGSPDLPTLIYLPGMHGDWTLVASFRAAISGHVRFVEITYPRTGTWSLDEYAAGIERALQAEGITEGWLIGESFGSQPAWQMIGRMQRRYSQLKIHGLILAGGFVKHPWPCGAKLLRFLTRTCPRFAIRVLVGIYASYARFRHRQAPETLTEIQTFVTNRLHPDDSAAMQRRFTLIIDEDLGPVARTCTLPVFALAGLVDPIVPTIVVRRWLSLSCLGFREARTIWNADHNVLATAPAKATAQVLEWMGRGK